MTDTLVRSGGRVGPNAITQVCDAVCRHHGRETARSLFEHAGILGRFEKPPRDMVPEEEVRALHTCLWRDLGAERASCLAWEAGLRTGDYLLSARIPKLAQRVLKLLPPRLAAIGLMAGIRRHAWTFAGSGEFEARVGRSCTVSIRGCPICARGQSGNERVCVYYTAVFQRVFRALVHRRAQVSETTCEAEGAPACTFSITW